MRFRHSPGFTIVELAVVMVLTLILAAMVFEFTRVSTNAERRERMALQAQQHARLALDAMAEELRMGDPQQIRVPGWGGVERGDGIGDPHWNRLQFRTWAWNAGSQQQVLSAWFEYRQDPNDPTVLQRVVYQDDPPATIDPTRTRVIARNIFDEDVNDNGVLDAGEDGNGDGRLQRGLWFQIDQEDNNGDGTLAVPGEDGNGNRHFDGHVNLIVTTRATDGQIAGQADMSTTAQFRNGQPR